MAETDSVSTNFQGDLGDPALDSDSGSFIASLVVHLVILVSLGMTPLFMSESKPAMTLDVPMPENVEEITLPEQFAVNELPTNEIVQIAPVTLAWHFPPRPKSPAFPRFQL